MKDLLENQPDHSGGEQSGQRETWQPPRLTVIGDVSVLTGRAGGAPADTSNTGTLVGSSGTII